MSCHSSSHRREGSASGDGGDNKRASNLGVTSETTETESEDRCEAGGLPAENHAEETDGGVAARLGGCEDEDEGHAEVDGENVTGFDDGEGHETAGEETVEGVETLSCGENIG